MVGGESAVEHGKPAPDIYLEAARWLDVDPSECLVFEDACRESNLRNHLVVL